MKALSAKIIASFATGLGCAVLGAGCSSSSVRKPAQNEPAPSSAPAIIRSDYAEGELTKLCEASIEDAKRKIDEIVGKRARTFDNTMLALETVLADFSDASQPLEFMGYVSRSATVRTEGTACEEKRGQFGVSVYTRKDIYSALKGLKGRNGDEKRLLSETLREFRLNGLDLSASKVEQVRQLKTQLSALGVQFASNIREDASTVEFAAAELEGLPAAFIARLKQPEPGRYVVSTSTPDYTQVMENARLEGTRLKMMTAYFNRAAAKNVGVLENAIELRRKTATLLGFKTWADYRAQGRMAKNGKEILGFLNGLRTKLAVRNRTDLAKLLAFKKELDPAAVELKLWDINYLAYQLKKRDFSLDDDKIREFFPADVVVNGMFDVYSKLLGVRFVEVQNAATWSADVKLYRIENTADGALVGYFYADFVPREGKYQHAAAFPLISGRLLPDGTYSHPVASIVANMNPPSEGKPSLLNHSEVETIFHEFGHIMHQTLTRAPYASQSGSSTAHDFVEAPSQMLENWVWSPEILRSLSGHYSDHSKKLPEDLLGKMIAARDFNQGYFYTRQLMLGLMDMEYHTAKGPVDSTAVQARLYKEISGLETPEGTHFQAGFGHLMGGYDAGYYGYLWSKVYAEDMFTRFEEKGLLNAEVGGNYRKNILERGNMSEALSLVTEFLGRAPNNAAFFKKLGI
jgi:thimet oligopeptidase